jgi:hypothetical protein
MVLDPATGILYASAEVETGGGVGHELYALSTTSRGVIWDRDLDQPGWEADAQLQRPALALDDGRVLVGFGGNYGDCNRYHGWVVGVPASGTGDLLTYRVPTANEGAIWAPGGIVVDGAGNVWVATGNGSASSGQAFDHGDAVIELSPTLSELQVFAPSDWAQDNEQDLDLGSTAPVLTADGQVFEVGKNATGFLLSATHLGGVGGQETSLDTCFSSGAVAYASPDLYVPCSNDGSVAQVVEGPGTLRRGWTWKAPGGSVWSPTVAGGLVWVVSDSGPTLFAVDTSTGTTRFRTTLATGTPPHFVGVTAAGGLILVAGTKAVEAFR